LKFKSLSNLHGVWDYAMIEKRIKRHFDGKFAKFAAHLMERLETEWRDEAEREWIQCDRHPRGLVLNRNDIQSDTRIITDKSSHPDTPKKQDWSWVKMKQNRACADLWARQINQLDCSSVWQGIHDGAELGGQYYLQNIELIEKLLAMGAVRLAAVLNGYEY
jgi:hypothetical protein